LAAKTPVDLYRAGDLDGAARGCEQVLRRQPRHHEALHLLGAIHLRQGRAAEAASLLRRAVEAAPAVAAYHETLAQALLKVRDLEGAEAAGRAALALEATLPGPHNLLGLVALERADLGAAHRHFSAALAARSPHLDATINLAVVMNRMGEHALAMRYAELALALRPDHPMAWINLGLALKALRRFPEAIAALERAGDSPVARFNLGFVHLAQDDLARGLPLFEARKALLGIGRGLERPEWQGEARPGETLLVVHEQGLGDTLLACRFYPALAERFARVVAWVQPPLARLIARAFPGVEVVTSIDGLRYDRWCAHLSLPLRLGVDSPAKIPNGPWLPRRRPDRAGGRLRVGLNWAGNPRYAYDAIRSTRLAEVAVLLQVGDVDWCSLHKGHLEHEAEAFGLPQPLRDARDFDDTARAIETLDLVISTETAIPNLSAAMGVPTCVLTSADYDWRWKAWYAGVTVCPQQAPGNWMGPVAGALEVLRGMLVAA
jgi:tetratricopeptide (TPR) repeat protein